MGRIDKNSETGVLNYRANSVFIRYTRGVEAEGERFRLAYRFVEDNFTPAPTPSTTASPVGGQNGKILKERYGLCLIVFVSPL